MENELLKELYLRYGQELMCYLRVLCHDEMMAEDILQETFCKALLSLPSEHTNVRAWLYMVSRNLALNLMKKRKHELQAGQWEEMEYVTQESKSPAEYADFSEEIIQREKNKELRRYVGQLDARKRELIELTYFEHFSLKEAARIMGLSYENVRVLSSRAKKDLRRILEVNGYEVS